MSQLGAAANEGISCSSFGQMIFSIQAQQEKESLKKKMRVGFKIFILTCFRHDIFSEYGWQNEKKFQLLIYCRKKSERVRKRN